MQLDDIIETGVLYTEGAELLRHKGAYVHRMPDGSYKITPRRVERVPVWETPRRESRDD